MGKGRRLTNKESMKMLDNEIFQTEERTSKLIKDLCNKRVIGIDVSHTPDQTVYLSSNRSLKHINNE